MLALRWLTMPCDGHHVSGGGTLAKHRGPRKSWGPYVTTGIALEVAAIVGFAYATDSHVSPPNLLAASIFVDGTKPSFGGSEEGVPFFRMADSFQGAYDMGADNVFIEYPRSLGPITGLGDPTYDESEGVAASEIVTAVKQARADDETGTIYVVGYSQGSGAAVKALDQLESEGFDTDGIEFVLASNPRRNDGGILTRLPKGVYLPVFGVTFGDGTTPESTKVLQVTKQYDGAADSPAYLFNVVSAANAAMGFYYLHPGYYKDVDPNDPNAIVTTSADGNVTDVLIPAPVGQLPLTMPLLQLGVPPTLVAAMDPFLRSVIETGYNRPDPNVPGSYPSEPVPFQLVPPPQRWLPDALSVAAGAMQSAQLLTGAAQPNSLVNDDVSTPAAVQPDARSVSVDDDKPVVEEEAEPEPDKPITGTGPNKFQPLKLPKTGWRPGDLLRSLFPPKTAKPASDPQSPSLDVDPSPSTDTNEPAGDTESGSAA
jgi:hypothetical protein